MIVALDDIRAQLRGAGMNRPEAIPVLDMMEARAQQFPQYAYDLQRWLDTDDPASTVHLRDVLAEPLRHHPTTVEIGKQFNPTTEWDNTWMPLDTAIHRHKCGQDPEIWL